MCSSYHDRTAVLYLDHDTFTVYFAMMSRRWLISFAAVAAVVTVSWPGLAQKPSAKPQALPSLPLMIAVAEEDGMPVQDDSWIDAQVGEAVRLFATVGIALHKASSRTLASRYARLESRADRDALSAELEPKKINVMIVSSLRDVDDPSLYRMGVHWRNRKNPNQHYVIVAKSARPSSLAHELGHYFGLGHSDVTDNVMSYSRSGATVFFDDQQGLKIKIFARMYVHGKLLIP